MVVTDCVLFNYKKDNHKEAKLFYSNRFTRLSGVPIVGSIYNSIKGLLVERDLTSGAYLLIFICALSYTISHPDLFISLNFSDLFSLHSEHHNTVFAGGVSIHSIMDYFSNAPLDVLVTFRLIAIMLGLGLTSVIVRYSSGYLKDLMSGMIERGAIYYIVSGIGLLVPITIVSAFDYNSHGFLPSMSFIVIVYTLFLAPLITSVGMIFFAFIGMLKKGLSSSKKAVPCSLKESITSNIDATAVFQLISMLVFLGGALFAAYFSYEPSKSTKEAMIAYVYTAWGLTIFLQIAFTYRHMTKTHTTRSGNTVTHHYTETHTHAEHEAQQARIKEQLPISTLVLGPNVAGASLVGYVMDVNLPSGFPGFALWLIFAFSLIGICGVIAQNANRESEHNTVGVYSSLRLLLYIAPAVASVWTIALILLAL
ncbi:hypothetical protein Q8W38_09035 [Vibrio splendidus]|uniref:Uncharacterized protein n=1 Tax=Vibrio splendidus TaxID=29497 RepID=A0ABD5A8M1_VIBSP|nr:hypothetical protein [Vibrio splendidus]MDP2489476.1 hypothetical protein [Vibrio splendidus]PMO49145.1 hypothetical protein BCT08_06040 [Vibrio splendidus]